MASLSEQVLQAPRPHEGRTPGSHMGCVVMTGLADHQWRRRFSNSLKSLLEGFYKPALMEATLSYLAGLWRSSVTAFGEAPGSAMPEDLRKSPLRKRKALRALNDTDPLSRRNLSIEIRQASLALAKRWTPVQGLISRHSRNLLRAYKQQGSMDLAIGTRSAQGAPA
jgi:hypothetical protein